MAADSLDSFGELGVEDSDALSGSRGRAWFKWIAWLGAFVMLLLVFSAFKLPESKLRAWVVGGIQSVLAPQGLGFRAETAELGLGWGLVYRFGNVAIIHQASGREILFEEISLKPSLLALLALQGRTQMSLVQPPGAASKGRRGRIELDLATPLTGAFESVDVQATLESIDAGLLQLLPLSTGGLQGNARLDGSIAVSGDLRTLASLQGQAELSIAGLSVDAQSFHGFAIPKLNVSEGKIVAKLAGGRLVLQTFKLGKSASDDLQATGTGEVTLGRTLYESQTNTQIRISFSQNVLRAFALLDMVLGAGKQPDGSYAYALRGPLLMPEMTPISGAP